MVEAEIEGVGGQASILAAEHIDGAADDAVVEEFRRARQEDYASLAREIETQPRSGSRSGHAGRGRGPGAASIGRCMRFVSAWQRSSASTSLTARDATVSSH